MATKAQLEELIAQLLAERENPSTAPTGDVVWRNANSMRSMGMAVVGDGIDPGEGAFLKVPTSKGGTKYIQTIHAVNPDGLGLRLWDSAKNDNGEIATWAYTYRIVPKDERGSLGYKGNVPLPR